MLTSIYGVSQDKWTAQYLADISVKSHLFGPNSFLKDLSEHPLQGSAVCLPFGNLVRLNEMKSKDL